MDFVRHDLGQCIEKVAGNNACGTGMKLGVNELGSAVDSYKQIPFAFFRLYFGKVDMKVSNRVSGKLLSLGLIAFDVR